MEKHRGNTDEPPKKISFGVLTKSLLKIRRSILNPNQVALDSLMKLPTEAFDISNPGELHLFLFTLKKSSRTKNEENIIRKTFKDFPFFQKIDPKVSSELLQGFSQYFEYVSRSAGSTIYQNGEEGDYLYIILSGRVLVLISKSGLMPSGIPLDPANRTPISIRKELSNQSPLSLPEEEEKTQSEHNPGRPSIPRRGSFFFKSSGFEMMTQEIERRSPPKKNESFQQRILKFIEMKYPEHYVAQELGAGESFGEVSLITNSSRNETTVCKETCHFLRIDRKNYKKILMMNHARGLHELLDFFSNLDIFSHWPKSQLSTFLKFFQMKVFTANDVLYKEKDESTFLYFIKEGEVELSKLVPFQGNGNSEEPVHGNISKQSIFEIQMYQTYNQFWQDSLHKRNFKRARLAILGPGSYFGEEEYLANTLRMTKAVVKVRSVIYFIKNELFSTNVKTKETLDKISGECKMKEDWRTRLVKKGLKEEKNLLSCENKAKSLHYESPSSKEKEDFQHRAPYQSRLFLEAKKQVLKMKKEQLLKNQQMQESNVFKLVTEKKNAKEDSEWKKPTFKLDLTKLLNKEKLISKLPLTVQSETKRTYLFKDEDLTSQDRFYTTSRHEQRSLENGGKTDDSHRLLKGKFERALEKLKLRRDNNFSHHNNTNSVRSQESESNQNKTQLQKLIQVMFQGVKKNAKGIKEEAAKDKEALSSRSQMKAISKNFRESSLSPLYLYNDSFQGISQEIRRENLKDRETKTKCENIHVLKLRQKMFSRNNNRSFRAMAFYGKERNRNKLNDFSMPLV